MTISPLSSIFSSTIIKALMAILFFGGVLLSLPTKVGAANLIANGPATIFYTTNGADPMMSTMDVPETLAGTESTNISDNYYTFTSTTYQWDGTAQNRLALPSTDYISTFGDESSISYNLPWLFPFYGQFFNQITVDTNGNIWFGSKGVAHSFNLASNGRGPVIAAWNNDLSSYYFGGVYVQHKTGPERVVIEWQTETYSNEGRRKPNSFEVVLFPSGDLRLDYGSFSTATSNKDFGSGISLNDGVYFINIKNSLGNIFDLAPQSYTITPTGSLYSLDASFSGGGNGTVSSNLGVSWRASNQTHFPPGTQVTLQATPDLGYKFDGWNGPCTGTGNCVFTLNQNTIVSAEFSLNTATQAVVSTQSGDSIYPSLQSAYNAAPTGSTLKLRATSFAESLNANVSKSLKIQGGYNNEYTAHTSGFSVLYGTLTISSGSLEINLLSIQ